MKVSTRTIGNDIINIDINSIKVNVGAYMAIDASTTNTGVAILSEEDGALMYTMSLEREKNIETPVKYKVRMKDVFRKILLENKSIKQIYYEEPMIHNIAAVKNLYMLRTFIEEIIVEEEPALSHIKFHEINNRRWKKILLAPDKVPTGTELEKAAVKNKLVSTVPCLNGVTQDELDAIGLGFAVFMGRGLEMESVSVHKFKYNIDFLALDDDIEVFETFMDNYRGPISVAENGISLVTVDKRADFDKAVFKAMGEEDKVLILKFPNGSHNDLILKHRVGELIGMSDYIYAIVWRATRKTTA